ncbi:hypothetical protein D3C71_20400 [compost metagenome]
MTDTSLDARYSLTNLSQAQAHVLCQALELLARLGLSQLEYLMEFVRMGGITGPDGKPIGLERVEQADGMVDTLKLLLCEYGGGASKGIGSPTTPKNAQVAWELFKVIRHRLAAERPSDGIGGVYSQDPYLVKYTQEPAVTLERVADAGAAQPD